MSDGQVVIGIAADAAEYNKALGAIPKATEKAFSSAFGSVNSIVDGLGRSVASIGDTLTKFITLPAIAAGTALAGITIGKGWERLTAIDTARAKLQGLGHDGQAIESIMDSALASVKGTSYGLGDAATIAASAVAAGVRSGADLTRYLTTVGDAAAISGRSLGEMGSIFNKVQTAQRAYLGELNQLADSGIPIFQWLADEAGTTADAVREMASDGEISSEMFFRAVEKNIGGAAKVIGENSLKASLENVGASISRIGANFLDAGGKGGGFFSQLQPLMVELMGELDSLEAGAADLGVEFGKAFADIVKWAKDVYDQWKKLSPEGKKLALQVVAITVAAGPLLKIVGNGIISVNRWHKEFKTLTDGLTKTKVAMNAVKVAGGALVAVLAGMVIGHIVTQLAEAADRSKRLKSATTDLEGALSKSNDAYIGTARDARAAAGGVSELEAASSKALDKQAELAQSLSEAWSDVGTDAALLDGYMRTIEELADKSMLGADKQAELANAVNGFNEITGNSISIIDPLNGKLSEQKDAVLAVADAYKEHARVAAAQEALIEIEKQRLITTAELEQAEADLAAMEDGLMLKFGGVELASDEAGRAYENQKNKVDDLRAAKESIVSTEEATKKVVEDSIDVLNRSVEALSALVSTHEGVPAILEESGHSVGDLSQAFADLGISTKDLEQISGEEMAAIAANFDGGWSSIYDLCVEYGAKIPEDYAANLANGQGAVDSAAESTLKGPLESAMAAAAEKTAEGGADVAESYAGGIEGGSGDVAGAGVLLKDAGIDPLTGQAWEFEAAGGENASAYADGFKGGGHFVKAAADEAAYKPVASVMEAAKAKAPGLGADAATGYAGGITSGTGAVVSASGGVREATEGMKPGDTWSWGSHAGENFAAGLRSTINAVRGAASEIGSTVARLLEHTKPPEGPLKEGEDKWGEHAGENFAAGLLRSAKKAFKAALGVAGAVEEGLADASVPTLEIPVELSDIAITRETMDAIADLAVIASSPIQADSGAAFGAAGAASDRDGRIVSALEGIGERIDALDRTLPRRIREGVPESYGLDVNGREAARMIKELI